MRKFIYLMYLYILIIWNKIKLLFYTPALLILVFYSISTNKKVRQKILDGDLYAATDYIGVFDNVAKDWSSKTKHTASLFWLIVLFIILKF